jgi:long-chain acyl-CoA synthetase
MSLSHSTILHRLARWAKDAPEASAQSYKPEGSSSWQTITAREFCDRVYYLALFLESSGISKKDIGVILSINSPEWVHVDLGTVLLGAKSAGIYPNSTPKEIRYVLEHTEAAVLSVQNKEFWEKVTADGMALPQTVRLVIALDNDTSISPLAVAYEDAVQAGRKIARSRSTSKTKLSAYLAAIDPDEGHFLIFTSGTTGVPKGALLSLDNFTFTADIAAEFWKLPSKGGDLCSFLPLCHVAEKIQSIGVGISKRYEVTFCSRIENIAKELPQIQPTLLLSVPRLWEKMQETVLSKIAQLPNAQKTLAEWALATGARVAESRYSGQLVSPMDAMQFKAADFLILSKIRREMGLGQARVLASGAAALSPQVSHWFHSLGLEILEDYGQTESTGVICMSEPGIDSSGTVGRPVPGLEIKIADDGEILTRGRHVFKGYYKNPEATAETLRNGWLHTGDLAEVTKAGTIRIRGRKKEIMKTSGGKMIAPIPLEEKLRAFSCISQVCIVGDGRKYLTALITLAEHARADSEANAHAQVKEAIDQLNQELPSYEQIKRFSILPGEFTVESGELTPTLKMKRNVVESKFKDVIDRMY